MKNERFIRFPGGFSKALTFSYDDGVSADIRFAGLLNKYALRGTFNLNSGIFPEKGNHDRLDEEECFKNFVSNGQEIAVHGKDHIFMSKVPATAALEEVLSCRKYLEEKYGRIVRGMAYAYGDFNEEVKRILAVSGIDYARTTRSTHDFALPDNWLELDPTCHHNDPMLFELLKAFIAAEPDKETKKRGALLFYVWGHSYEFNDHDNWDMIESFMQEVSAAQGIWKCTNGELYDYVKAYESLVWSADGSMVYNPRCVTVWMDFQGKTYEIGSGATLKLTSGDMRDCI